MILLTHPTGNANVRAIAESLYRAEQLGTFYTSIATFPGNFWDKASALPGLSDFGRRRFASELQPLTRQYPFKELGRMVAKKGVFSQLATHETGPFSVDGVYHALDHKVATTITKNPNKFTAVYAYEDGALEAFTAAKKAGISCIYDLPIAYWETKQKLMQEEAERLPGWASTLGGSINDSQEKLDRKTRELELADAVVGPGSFVMDSLPGWAVDKHRIVSPFGSPGTAATGPLKVKPTDRPLRVLFVGSMTQRKGLADLFAAMKELDPARVELVVLGSQLAPMEFYREQCADFTYETTRPHAEVLELMASCDVFCLPSIAEGRALVMQEAMSQGLPVIITANTGGADLVIPDETGFLVPIRSPKAIAAGIQWFVENRDEIPRMGEAARQHAARYTWASYGDTVVAETIKYLRQNKPA